MPRKPRVRRINGTGALVTIDEVRFKGPGGVFRGLGTRVTFADGWKATFASPVRTRNEEEAVVEMAKWMKDKGDKSE
jgi:hypothetical protein